MRRLILLLTLGLLVIGGTLFLPIFGNPLISLQGLLRSQVRTFSSREILEEISDVYRLHTVEYVYRMVFPHDFYPPELNLSMVFDSLGRGNGTPEELLTPEELAYLRAYNIAYEAGLPTAPEGDQFVVVTARVRAGYATTPEDQPDLFRLEPPADATAPVTPEETRITVFLPEAEIRGVTIEDLNQENYPYPPARVDAEEWRAISSFVGEQAKARTIRDGILDEAREKAVSFLGGLLEEAGFREVHFETP